MLLYIRKMKVGRPDAKDTKVGALISKEHLEKVKKNSQLCRDVVRKFYVLGNAVSQRELH